MSGDPPPRKHLKKQTLYGCLNSLISSIQHGICVLVYSTTSGWLFASSMLIITAASHPGNGSLFGRESQHTKKWISWLKCKYLCRLMWVTHGRALLVSPGGCPPSYRCFGWCMLLPSELGEIKWSFGRSADFPTWWGELLRFLLLAPV